MLLGAGQVGNMARRMGLVDGLVLLVDHLVAVDADREDGHVAPPCAVLALVEAARTRHRH